MARQIRIDALAAECSVAPREVLRVLIDLGQFRYTRFNQQLSEDLAQQVRDALKPAAPKRGGAPSNSEEDLFAMAMSAAGVQPLDARAGKPAGSARRTAKKKARPPGKASQAAPPPGAPPAREPDASPAPVAEPGPVAAPAAVSSSVAAAPEGAPPPPPAPPPDPAEQASTAVAALEAELSDLRAAHAALAAEHRHALAGHAEAEARCHELQLLADTLASGDLAIEGAPSTGLLELLQARGLRGLDEAGFALRALLAGHLLDSSLPYLRSLDAPRLARVLTERLCLCCGREACGRPEAVEQVLVPLQRCELCGGCDLPRVHQAYSDACLLSGINRVLLVGGRRWHHGWHEAGLDRRVKVRLWAGAQPLVERNLDEDLTWAQLVLLWDDGALGPQLAAAVERRRERGLLRVAGGSMGEILEQAVSLIEAMDPAELV